MALFVGVGWRGWRCPGVNGRTERAVPVQACHRPLRLLPPLDAFLQPWLHCDVSEPSSRVPGPGEWVLLSYRLPREPSGPRTTLWRRLKRLGVAQLADGLVALPADA